jgi:PhnB protein
VVVAPPSSVPSAVPYFCPHPGGNHVAASGLVAYIAPSDAVAAAEFYTTAFGATDVTPMMADDGKRYMHCSFVVNAASST